jgi:hypothetical protein
MSSVELVVLELEGRVNVMPMPDELENEEAVWSVATRDGLDTTAPICKQGLQEDRQLGMKGATREEWGRSSTHRMACHDPWTAFE